MFGVGGVLLYAAVKDKNPKDVVVSALSNKSAGKAKKPAGNAGSSAPNNTQDSRLGTVVGASTAAGFTTPYVVPAVYPSN